MKNTLHAQVLADAGAAAIVQRVAPYLLAMLLALGLLATAGNGAASAKPRKSHAVDLTGFGPVPRIEPPPLHDPVPPAAAAPARFFTINRVLARLEGRGSGDTRLASRAGGDTLSDAAPSLPAPSGDEPFGLFTFQAPEGAVSQKWRAVSFGIAKDLDAMARCRALADACTSAAARFIAVIDAAARHDGRARLDAVNRAVNGAIIYMTDMQQHGVPDLWSSPLSTFATLRGDCEDYAIAKYVALRAAGVAAGDLRIVLARDNALGEDHAVLAARQDGRWLVLDNRRMRMLALGELPDYVPLVALGADGFAPMEGYAMHTPTGGPTGALRRRR